MLQLSTAKDEWQAAVDELKEVRSEYEEWQSTIPDNMQDGVTYNKIDELLSSTEGVEEEIDLSSAEKLLEMAENADLPVGFGRD